MADSFTDFIQNLFPSMGQTQQPMLTSTFTDPSAYRMSPEAAAYYADPFRRQNTIQQASLDAALKKKQADEAAQRLSGMLSTGVDGGMSDQGLNPAVEAFLNAETPAERDARMTQVSNFLNPFSTQPINYATLLGLNSPTAMAAQNAVKGGMFGGIVSNLFGIPAGATPAPVVDMSIVSADPFSSSAQTGGGYGYGFDPEVGAPSSGGGGGASASDAGAGMSSTSSDAGAVTTDSGVSVGYGGGYGW